MVEMQRHPEAATSLAATLDDIAALTAADMPFAAQVAQLAAQADTIDELHVLLVSLYRLTSDQGASFVPDLVDTMLTRIETALDHGADGATAWRRLG